MPIILILWVVLPWSWQIGPAIAAPQIIAAKKFQMDPAPKGSGAFLHQISDDLDGLLQDIRRELKRFAEQLQKIPESQGFKRLEKEWEGLLDKIKRAEKLARNKFQKEILTRLKEELEKLREKLQNSKRKKGTKPLEVLVLTTITPILCFCLHTKGRCLLNTFHFL